MMKVRSESQALIEDEQSTSLAIMRPRRELSLKERGEQCKKMELSQKSFSMINDLIGDIGDIPIVGDFLSPFLTGASIVTHLTSGGLDIASTALDCADLPFDEIKEIMDKRFNELERRLDRNDAALQAVSKLVTKTLDEIEISRQLMNKRFDEVLVSIENTKIQPIVSKINRFAQYFDTERDRIRGLKIDDYVAKLQEPNSILLYLKDSRTPKGDSLHAPLFEIIDLNYAVPDGMDDEIAFKALLSLIYGTETYVSVMYFLLEQYTFLSNYHYERGELDLYNEYFDYIHNVYLDFKSSLTGGGSTKGKPLLDYVINVLNTVKGIEFIRLQKDDLVKEINNKINKFTEFKDEIEHMKLPITTATPKNFVQISFKKDILTPIGEWENSKEIRYAVMYKSSDAFSNVGEWSKPTIIRKKACPTLRIPVDELRKNRLIFRKFDNDQPQLAGTIKPYDTEFVDINRDVFNAAEMSDKDTGLEEAKVFLSNGGNINEAFEKGRRAFHAVAYSGNYKLGTYFLLIDNTTNINVRDNNGLTPLHVAANVGQSGFVKFLLTHKASVNAKTDAEEITPLHLAARQGFVKTVTALLQSGDIAVNSRNRSGFTALHNAVLGGRYVLAVLIGNDKVDINAKSKTGLTPFHLAAINNDRDVAEILVGSGKVDINAGDSKGMTPLHHAAMLGNLEMVHYLMALEGIDINAVTIDNKWTPLHYAIMFRKDDVAKELLNTNKIDISVRADGGITPFHFAVTFGRNKVVQELLTKKVKIEEKTEEGYTALHLASMRLKSDLVTLLLDNHANIEAQTVNRTTPLHVAAKNGRTEPTITLLERGANTRTNDIDGQAPIHVAAFNDQMDVVRALLARDDSLKELKNTNEETPLIVASQKSNTAIVKDLIDKGANINAQDKDGVASIHIFAKKGNDDMVKYLLDKGANVYIQDRNGLNFFYYAIQNDRFNVVKYALSEKRFNWDTLDQTRNHCHDPGRCSIKYFAFCDAATFGKLNILKYFMDEKKANLCMPLHVSARYGHLDLVKYLVEKKKQKVDGPRFGGVINTPLCDAALNGKIEVVKYLVEKKADVNHRCLFLSKALDMAIMGNHLEIVKFLVDHKADIRRGDIAGNTPLHNAVSNNRIEIVKYLVEEKNVDMDVGNGEWNTPLHIAAERGYLDMVKFLVEKGADVHKLNRNGQTPLEAARSRYSSEVVSFLEAKTGRVFRNIAPKKIPANVPFLAYNKLPQRSVRRINNDSRKFANENDEPSAKNSGINATQDVDIISTLLFLDVLIRYFTNEKYISSNDESMSDADAQVYALKIVENFEELYNQLNNMASDEEIDFSQMHANIYKAIKAGKGSKIHDILCSYADSFMSLNPEDKEKLVNALSSMVPSIKNTEFITSNAEEFKQLPYAIMKSCSNLEENPSSLLF